MTGDVVRPDGPQVRKLRTTKGWTQEDLAERVRARAGSFSKRTLEKIEAGRPVHLRSIRVVAEELGIDVEAILHDFDATLHNLPFRLTSFIGRENECAEISHLLSHTRLVTLTGTGGCGKSRLALEVATDLVSDYPDGVWLVELAALADPALVPQAMARALSVREEPRRPLTETLIRDLKSKRTLVLLDNCEHLLSACTELVGVLLPACAELRILATSRESMNFAGETVISVPALRLPDANREFQLDELHEVESVRLFVERAAAVRSDFSLSKSNARAVVEICEHLDGIPLALELAAARVKTVSAEEIARRLDDRFQVLSDGHRAVLPQHRTLRALIDWSYDLLSDDERTLLRRLSVFAGGCTLQAAERVCAGDGIEQGDVLDLLSHLVGKSLVEMHAGEERDTGTTRYRLLETVREYAQERLVEEGEDGPARDRHRDFFLALAEEAEPELDGANQSAWLSRLDEEHDNLRASLKACVAGDNDDRQLGLRLAGALGQFWEIRGYRNEGRAICLELLARTDGNARSSTRAKALKVAGILSEVLGDFGAARSFHEENLSINRELGHRANIASSLNNLGIIAIRQGDYDEARRLNEEALAIRRELGDKRGITHSLMNLGIMARRQGDYFTARSYYEECLEIARELQDDRQVGMALHNLGNVSYFQGDWAETCRLCEESLAIFRELGDKYGIANVLNTLGNMAWKQGDYAAASPMYEERLAIMRELGEMGGVGMTLQNLGNVALDRGDYAEARVRYEEGLAIYRELGDKPGIADMFGNLGNLSRNQGDYAAAASLHEKSLAIVRELGDKHGIAVTLQNLGNVAFRRGHLDEARGYYEESLAMRRELSEKVEISMLQNRLGNVALLQGNYAEARDLLGKSTALAQEMGDKRRLAESIFSFGFLASQEEDLERAARLLAAGEALARDRGWIPEPDDRHEIDKQVAALRAKLGDAVFTREWSVGQAMDLDRAIQYAREK